MVNTVLWNVTSYSDIPSSALKIEAETLLPTHQTTCRHVPEVANLQLRKKR
jgi:hypothetical protein